MGRPSVPRTIWRPWTGAVLYLAPEPFRLEASASNPISDCIYPPVFFLKFTLSGTTFPAFGSLKTAWRAGRGCTSGAPGPARLAVLEGPPSAAVSWAAVPVLAAAAVVAALAVATAAALVEGYSSAVAALPEGHSSAGAALAVGAAAALVEGHSCAVAAPVAATAAARAAVAAAALPPGRSFAAAPVMPHDGQDGSKRPLRV